MQPVLTIQCCGLSLSLRLPSVPQSLREQKLLRSFLLQEVRREYGGFFIGSDWCTQMKLVTSWDPEPRPATLTSCSSHWALGHLSSWPSWSWNLASSPCSAPGHGLALLPILGGWRRCLLPYCFLTDVPAPAWVKWRLEATQRCHLAVHGG